MLMHIPKTELAKLGWRPPEGNEVVVFYSNFVEHCSKDAASDIGVVLQRLSVIINDITADEVIDFVGVFPQQTVPHLRCFVGIHVSTGRDVDSPHVDCFT